MKSTKWPKHFPPLTEEQNRIRDDFMAHWLSIIGKKYAAVEKFNHSYSASNSSADFTSTLEIGAGLGTHLNYERLSPKQEKNYVSLELRGELAGAIRTQYPRVQVITGNIQDRLPFPDGHFDRILAIHVLEHLYDLPAAVKEIHRLCNPERGELSVVIPCEGGLAYGLSRRISAKRIFEKRYRQPYKWFIEREHVSGPADILEVLSEHFGVSHSQFFPLRVPLFSLNLCVGLTFKPIRRVSQENAGRRRIA